MKKNRYLVDTDVIINYLKGKDISKDFLMKIIDGKAIGALIAATAAVKGLILATANEKHFKIFAEIEMEFLHEI